MRQDNCADTNRLAKRSLLFTWCPGLLERVCFKWVHLQIFLSLRVSFCQEDNSIQRLWFIGRKEGLEKQFMARLCVFSTARTDPLNNPTQSSTFIAVCPHTTLHSCFTLSAGEVYLLRYQGSSGGSWRTFCCCDIVKHHLIHCGMTHTYMVWE